MLGSGTQKQRADLLSSSAASFTKTKATISPLPGLGWITVCQRGWQVCVCAPSPFTTSLPLLSFFFPPTLYSPYQSMKESSMQDFPFPSYLQISESTLQSQSHFFFTANRPPRLERLSTKCTLTPQKTYDSADVREDQKKKLGDRCSKIIAQLQTEPRPHATPKEVTARSDGSNRSNGVISTADLSLPCRLAELTGIQSITKPQCTLNKSWTLQIKAWFLRLHMFRS